MTLLSVSDVSIAFGATTILEKVTFTIDAGEKWAVIGRNGAGKTSLFKVLAGMMPPTGGVVARPSTMKLAVLDQHRTFAPEATVWDAVAEAFAPLRALEASLAQQAANLETDHSEATLDRYGRDLERFEREGGYQYAARVDEVLTGLGFDAAEARTQQLGVMSGGERGRVALARQLATPADLLLLDEPTNHLDLDTTRWLEAELRASDRTLLVVSHDRAFLDAIADHVLHIEARTAFTYTGGYSAFVRQREERRLTQQRQFEQQQRKISSEQDYIARNIAGQNSSQAKGRRKRLERMARLTPPPGADAVMILKLQAGERSGDRVVECEKLSIRIGERTLLDDVTLVLPRQEVVALVGPNGAGKSTFIRTLLGDRAPDDGTVRVGPSTRVAWYRQELGHLPLQATVFESVATLRPFWERRDVLGHLGKFGFGGDESQRTLGTLSGGERARVAMALLTLERCNLLVLDEPTNHLDVETIEALEDAIDAYDGTVLLVSHDRAVLRGLATQVWELRDETIVPFDGSFPEWEEAVETARRSEPSARAQRAEKASRGNDAKKDASRDTSRDASREQRRRQRDLVKRVEEMEAAVHLAESRVGRLAKALEDPSLHDGSADGARRAAEIAAELSEARKALGSAERAWEQAAEDLEAIGIDG